MLGQQFRATFIYNIIIHTCIEHHVFSKNSILTSYISFNVIFSNFQPFFPYLYVVLVFFSTCLQYLNLSLPPGAIQGWCCFHLNGNEEERTKSSRFVAGFWGEEGTFFLLKSYLFRWHTYFRGCNPSKPYKWPWFQVGSIVVYVDVEKFVDSVWKN